MIVLLKKTINFFFYTDCDVNCHKKCEKLTANLCGVNQKLIVEAIASVRKGKKIQIKIVSYNFIHYPR